MPIYNVEIYLERCLNSLINQTYQDIEIILINDGSKDNSGEICNMYSKKDNRIKVIHQKNSGVSVARNKGIEQSTGNFITFVDPDDCVENNFVEILVNNAISNNSDLTVCGYRKVFEDGKTISCTMKNDLIEIEDIGLHKYLKDYFLLFKHAFCVWNKLYKRDLIVKYNIKFDPQISYGEDLLFNLFYLTHSKVITSISHELINYYQRTFSLSQSPKNELYNTTYLVSKYESYLNKFHKFELDIYLIVFCSELTTALNHLRNSKNKGYIESCLKSITKDKLFKKYCKKILINKDCSNFLVTQGNNFKGILLYKFIILMLLLGRNSFVMNKFINKVDKNSPQYLF